MTASDRLVGIRAKIERAKYHISDIEARVQSFRETNPHRVVFDQHHETGHISFRTKFLSELPVDISLIVGEAINQLRSTLDHLIWQLVEAHGKLLPGTWTGFPIYDALAKYEEKAPGKIKGVSPDAIRLINDIKPYKGANDDLWLLNELNRIDKHRVLLIVALGMQQFAFSCDWDTTPLSDNPVIQQLLSQAVEIKQGVRTETSVSVTPLPGLPILKDGAEFAVISWPDGPKLKVNDNLNLAFEIAFGEPEIINGRPILPFLHKLRNLVDGIVSQFERERCLD